MPLFSSKFAPKSVPVRRVESRVLQAEFGGEFAAAELSLDAPPPRLRLGDFEITFEDGQWVPTSGRAGAAHRESQQLRRAARRLEDENNMLRLKMELLLDLAAESAVGERGEGGKRKK